MNFSVEKKMINENDTSVQSAEERKTEEFFNIGYLFQTGVVQGYLLDPLAVFASCFEDLRHAHLIQQLFLCPRSQLVGRDEQSRRKGKD